MVLRAAGAAPFMLGERGFKKLKNRKTKVASWYFDLNMILDYWGCFGPKRFYHHTGMVSNWCVSSSLPSEMPAAASQYK